MTTSYHQCITSGGTFQMPMTLFRVSGEKAAAFLHGQLTNHIIGLQEGQINYNLLLTQKGKVVADLYVIRQKDDFLLLIEKNYQEKIKEHLEKLAPLSRVMISDETNRYNFFHVCSLNPLSSSQVRDPYLNYRTDRLGIPGHDFFVPKGQETTLIKDLEELKLVKMDETLQEIIRIEQGVCKVGVDATEANLPQEARLDRALHFDKGCYLGQEIIARLHFRGHVNKKLVGLQMEGRRPPDLPCLIYDEEREVGMITSSVFSPKLSAPLALGFVPYESADKTGKKFQIGNEKIQAVIVELPLHPVV